MPFWTFTAFSRSLHAAHPSPTRASTPAGARSPRQGEAALSAGHVGVSEHILRSQLSAEDERREGATPIPGGSADGHELSALATEYDWLTFYRALDSAGLPLGEVARALKHACQPENARLAPSGVTLPLCAAGQTPADGCYAPDLDCGDESGFLWKPGSSGSQAPVMARAIYWLDRPVTYDPVTSPTWPGAPVYDRGGLLDGARRVWGEVDARTLDVERLGLDHGVDENVAP